MLSLVIHAMLGLPILQADPSSVANYSSVAGRVLRQMPDPRKSRCEGKNRTQPLPTPPPPLAASYIEAFAPLSKEADPEALLGATVSPWMRTALRAWSGAHFNTARRQLTHGLCHLSVGTVQVSDDKEPEIEMARVTLSSKPGQPDEPWRIGTTKRYEIASNTKVFTSILAQALVNDGLFKWTDKIGDHLPIGKWPYRPRDRSILDITLEQLASHSAGLMDSSPFMPDRTKINQFSGFTLDQMLKALTDVSRFRARPTGGGNFKYSNWVRATNAPPRCPDGCDLQCWLPWLPAAPFAPNSRSLMDILARATATGLRASRLHLGKLDKYIQRRQQHRQPVLHDLRRPPLEAHLRAAQHDGL